jgi:MYXO-CTERM domain-containing protein
MRASIFISVLGAAGLAHAHGVGGHVHVTGWAIEQLPAASPLAAFFADPVVLDAALMGAGFPDSGYAAGDAYGELAHWEPFVDAHVAWIRERYEANGGYDDPEVRRHIGFLMGSAAHGLQDELFDSVFLFQVREKDGAGQEEADPGTDGFLAVDGHLRFRPTLWLPGEALAEVFAARGHAVTAATMRGGLSQVRFYVNGLQAIGIQLDAEHRPQLPWTADHYLDPTVPGSLAAEVPATAAYLEALWARLHGEFPVAGLGVHGWPHQRRLRSRQADTVDGWITVVFGAGAVVGSLTGDTVQLLDPDGQPVPIQVGHTRWGGAPGDSTRLVRLMPTEPLAPDTTYTVRLAPGITLLDGQVLDTPWTWAVRTPCDDPQAEGCADPEPAPFPPPPPEPVDAGPEPDAAVADAGIPDAEPVVDVGVMADAAPAVDAQTSGADGDDDGCRSAPAPGAWGALFALLGLWTRRRRG